MIECFKDVYSYLETRGCKPKLHVLDNECSRAIKKQIKSEGTKIQLVEPHNHRVNAAEPAVKTAKYHFIASLATVSPDCPLQIWCQFLPQVQMTLNMLRTSRRDLTKSAHDNEMFCFAALADANEGVIYSNQTGRFPVMSHEGMHYLFIAFVYDQNAILIQPLRNPEDSSMIECF